MDEIKESERSLECAFKGGKSLSAWSSGFGALRWAPKENERVVECAEIGMGRNL
jgi:hypothetical protein